MNRALRPLFATTAIFLLAYFLAVAQFPAMRVTGHLEPVSDPRSYEDVSL